HEPDRATAAFGKTVTRENRFQIVDEISHQIVLYRKESHAITFEYFAVENVDDLEQLPKIAASFAQQQDVARVVRDDIRAFAQVRHEQALHLGSGNKFHTDDLQHDLIIGRCLAHLFLYFQRLPDSRIGRNNLVEIAHLHHRRAIDLQNGF